MIDRDIFGEIEVSPKNTMKFKIEVIGSDNSDIISEIESRAIDNSYIPTEIQIRVSDTYDVNSEVDIAYRGNSYIYAEIQPLGFNNINAEIEVRPHNRMSSLYEIVEPPKITTILNPIKDASTRENAIFGKVNYGGYTSLNVGSDSDNIFRSHLQFNFDTWNPFYKIIDVKLRLYYSGTIPNNVAMEIFTLNEYWSEYGINDYNKPSPITFVQDEYINNEIERYVEFDLTNVTKEWIDNIISNYGIVIRYKDESNTNYGYVKFKSRESSTPPELIITSYDNRIYSYGRSYVPSEIFVWIKKDSDVLAEIEVSSVYANKYILGEIWCHKYDIPVWEDIESEITVNKPYIPSEITIYQSDNDYVLGEITPRLYLESTIHASILVNKPYVASEIEIKYWDKLNSEIEIRAVSSNDKYAELSVSRDFIYSELLARAVNNSYIESEITIETSDYSYVNAEISVNRDYVYAEITPKLLGVDAVDSDIIIRAIKQNDMLSEISINRDFIYAEIEPISYKENYIDSEIEVKYWDNILAEIEVFKFNDIHAEIDVVKSSYLLSEITVSRDGINSEITVWNHGNSNIPSEIIVRVENISSINAEITVKGNSGAYVIMY